MLRRSDSRKSGVVATPWRLLSLLRGSPIYSGDSATQAAPSSDVTPRDVRVTPADDSVTRRSLASRAVVAAAIGLAAGLASWAITEKPGYRSADFAAWYLAAQALAAGGDPFAATAAEFRSGLLYPMPAALVTVPFTALEVRHAGPVFVALTTGILAFVLTRRAWWPLVCLASGAFLGAVAIQQWSMLLLAGAVAGWPWLVAIKPNMGLAIAAAHPGRWRQLLVAAALLVGTLALVPDWPWRWIETTRATDMHYALWHTGAGLIVLLAWLRWRRPEARLLGTLALVPISPLPYDLLMLFAIPRSRAEALALCVTTTGAFWYVLRLMEHGTREAVFAGAGWAALVGGYVPALVMVLRRPNVEDA
jgi:hypothetical protein